jgi:hypothetical protein
MQNDPNFSNSRSFTTLGMSFSSTDKLEFPIILKFELSKVQEIPYLLLIYSYATFKECQLDLHYLSSVFRIPKNMDMHAFIPQIYP